MRKNQYCKINEEFDLKEFVETNDSSAQRTRWITIVLVVATVIIGIGFYNSLNSSWAQYRVKALKNFEGFPGNINHNKTKPILDVYFGKDDFAALQVFVCHFNETKFSSQDEINDVTYYLYRTLSRKTTELINAECLNRQDEKRDKKEKEKSKGLTDAFFYDFNNLVLKDKFLYTPERFPDNTSRTLETKWLLEKAEKNVNALQKNVLQFSQVNEEPQRNNQISNDIPIANNNSTLNNSVENSNTQQSISRNSNQPTTEAFVIELENKELIRLNRLLLEERYSGEIYPSRDIVPNPQVSLAKEIATYIAFDDKVQFVEIPVFGIAIDVNDLGFIGGFSLLIILFLLRYSQTREIKNLTTSFREAFEHWKFCSFYHALAMRQVLTMPKMDRENENPILAISSKWVLLFPLIVITLGVSYDIYSVLYLELFKWDEVEGQMLMQIISVLLIFFASFKCVERQIYIEILWDDYFIILKEIQQYTTKIEFDKRDHKAMFKKILDERFYDPEIKEKWYKKLFTRKYISRFIPFVKRETDGIEINKNNETSSSKTED